MSMETLKHWCIGKYIDLCHFCTCNKLPQFIFNNTHVISQNTIVFFKAMAAYEEKVPVDEEAENLNT